MLVSTAVIVMQVEFQNISAEVGEPFFHRDRRKKVAVPGIETDPEII